MPQIGISTNSIDNTSPSTTLLKTGFFATLPDAGFNLIQADKVSGFSLSTNEPTGTSIKYAFKTEYYWFRLTTEGYAENFLTGDIEASDVREYGNTTSELQAIKNIPVFEGKKVQVAILLEAEDSKISRPVLNSFKVRYTSNLTDLQHTEYSAVYELGQNAYLSTSEYEPIASGNSKVEVTAQITKADGTKTAWLPLGQLTGQACTKLQFKGEYTVGDVNSGKSSLKYVKAIYADGSEPVSGEVDAELYSVMQDWYMNIRQCRLTVKHTPLTMSDITAYIALRDIPSEIRSEVLGSGTGTRKTYQLKNTKGLKHDSLKVYYNGVRQITGYELNSEVGRVTCTAPQGSTITCDYEYGWDTESWQELTLSKRKIYPDYVQSEYLHSFDTESRRVCGLKFVLNMKYGHTDREQLGTSSEGLQVLKLAHPVRNGELKLFASGQEIDGKNWLLREDTQYVDVLVKKGYALTATYDWVSEIPTIYQFAGVFAE